MGTQPVSASQLVERGGMIRNRHRLRGDDQVGCLSWPACVRGGLLCPQPDSFAASLNPCCHFAPPASACPDDVPPPANSDGSYGITGAVKDVVISEVTPSTGLSPVLWIAAGSAIALLLFRR